MSWQTARSVGDIAVSLRRLLLHGIRELWDVETKVFSQWGEDGIIAFLCDSLSIAKPKIIEFGAGAFKECNSRYLAESYNASVFAVDSRHDLLNSLDSSELKWRNSIWLVNEWITPASAFVLLETAKQFMDGTDVLSLDIDGNDYWVLSSLDLTGIRILVVEYNPLFGGMLPVTIPRDDNFDRQTRHYSSLYYGASIGAFVSQLCGSDEFRFVGTNRAGNNAFFVRSEEAHKVPLPLPSLQNLSRYCDWRVRESRDPSGQLNYLYGLNRVNEIRHLPVVNLNTGDTVTLAEVFGLGE